MKSLSEVIGQMYLDTFEGHVIDTYAYGKSDSKKDGDTVTGKALCMNGSIYAAIDFDINEEDIQPAIKTQLLEHFTGKAKIVETYSGGFHLYVKDDGSWSDLDKNRCTQVYYSEETYRRTATGLENSYVIDIFLSHIPEKRSLIVLPGSEVRTAKSNNVIGTYVLLRDCKNENLITFTECLHMLFDRMGILIEKPIKTKALPPPKEPITKPVSTEQAPAAEQKQSKVSKMLFDAIVAGFENVVIHAESSNLEEEIGILQVVTSLNACENDDKSSHHDKHKPYVKSPQ